MDKCILHSHEILAIGVATNLLRKELLQNNGVQDNLHLEDDWLEEFCQILNYYKSVGQIRLRHSSEEVLKYYMITKAN